MPQSLFVTTTLAAPFACLAVACGSSFPPSAVPEAHAASPVHLRVVRGAAAAPAVGDDPARVDAYLRNLKHDLESVSEPHPRWSKNRAERKLTTADVDALNQHYEDERYRLLGPDGNVAMVVVGGIFTTIGGLGGLATPVLVITGMAMDNGPILFFSVVAGLPATGLFLGIGIPLINGGQPDKPSSGTASIAVPEIGVGPGGITSRWRF